ncbi:hypothetical protein ACTFIT_009564 [Dictyostelium discoideum]
MGRKNKLKVDLNKPLQGTATVQSKEKTTLKVIDPIKNFPELQNKPELEMAKLLQMSEKVNKDELEPIEKYNIENGNNDDEDNEDEDDKMEDEDDENDENKNSEKKMSHREKFLLKRKLKNEVVTLKEQRKKCKKTNFVQKKEKKSLSQEIHEKVNATLKKKKL